MLVVVFLNGRGEKVKREFDSEYHCRRFVNRLRHSRRCRLISCPLFER